MRKLVFVVEDDQYLRTDFSELVAEEGFEVKSFVNGQEGLDALINAPVLPDLILLDLMMPILNGYQFLEEFARHEAFSKIKVLVMSADRGASGKITVTPKISFLSKPVDLDVFLNTVNSLLN